MNKPIPIVYYSIEDVSDYECGDVARYTIWCMAAFGGIVLAYCAGMYLIVAVI